MYTRFLTYDLNNGSAEDYQELYNLIDEYKGIKITESTYKIKTSDDLNTFKSKFKKVTSDGDIVFVLISKKNDTIEEQRIR